MKPACLIDGTELGTEKQSTFLHQRNCSTTEAFPEDHRFSQIPPDHSGIQVFWIIESGNFFYVNDTACNSLGYSREELRSMTFMDLVPELDEKSWQEYWRQLHTEGCKKYEAVHRRKDGTTFPVEVIAMKPEFGDEPFICSFVQDITSRKQAEAAALRESEEKFRLLTEISPNAIVLIQEKRIVYVNHAAIEIFGYTREELAGTEFWRHCHEEYQDIARKRGFARQQGEPISRVYEYKIVAKNGSYRWVMASSAPLEFDGSPALMATLMDISETKRTEEKLRESEARLRLAMDMSRLVQWEYDAETRMFRFDEHFYSLYGTSAAREGGSFMSTKTYLHKFVHPDDVQFVKESMQRVLTDIAGSPACQIEHRIIRADGEKRHISVRWEAIRDHGGRVIRIRGANQDITERKCADEERKNLEAQLHQAQKMEAIGQLAGGVAHDFNNVLTAIMGFAEVMSMRMDPKNPLRHHVSQIITASDRAAELVHGLLAFSRKQILHKRDYDVREIVYGVKNMLRRLIPEDIDFIINCAVSDMIVNADKGQIEQVLMNLVTNARDAMPNGGVLTIEADLYVMDKKFIRKHGFGLSGTYSRLIIRDTGCGMDKQTLNKIFEPFFTTKKPGKGTGLGLSIIYGIVKQHHGFITVNSSPGCGTTFHLYLPLADQKITDQPVVEQTVEAVLHGTETVLLAEDDDMIRDLNRMILETMGYSVIDAVDGRDALEKLQNNNTSVDVLVTDVVMPNMDGKMLYEEVRKIRPDLKVIFMSGHTADVVDSRGIANDSVNFMEKPVMPTEFLRKLREILDNEDISSVE